MRIKTIYTLPVWLRDGEPYVPRLNEVYEGETCIAWCNVADVTIDGEDHRLLLNMGAI